MTMATKPALKLSAALLVLLVLAGLWIAGREEVTRWIAEQAVEAAEGKLALEGVRGSLYGPIAIDRAVYEDTERRVVLSGLELDWSAWSLFKLHVFVSRLHADSIELNTKIGTDKPPKLPETLELPFTYTIESASVNSLMLASAESGQRLENIRLQARYDGDTHSFTLDHLDTPWGAVGGQVRLADASPFAIDGEARLSGRVNEKPISADVRVSGALTELTFAANAKGQSLDAGAVFAAKPFGPAPLQRIELDARGLNPAEWGKALPVAAIHAVVIAQTELDNQLRGEAKIVNESPGTLDSGRLPFQSLATEIRSDFKQLALNGIRLDLSRAGVFEGHGEYADGVIKLDLVTGDLNLRGIEASLNETSLKGAIQLAARPEEQSLGADFQYERYQIQLKASRAQNKVTVQQAQVRAGAAQLQASGSMTLAHPQTFEARGELSSFNPQAFGDYPKARINANFSLEGERIPQLRAALAYSIRNSQLRNQPLAGSGEVLVTPSRIEKANLELALSQNRLTAYGSFGNAGDALEFKLVAPRLASLGEGYAGSLKATGSVKGALKSPELKLVLSAQNLRTPALALVSLNADIRASAVEGEYTQPEAAFTVKAENIQAPRGHRIQALEGGGELKRGFDGRLHLELAATGYRSAALELASARLSATGTRGKHAFVFSAKGLDLDLSAQLRGGLTEANAWSGALTELANRGAYPVSLKGPARLEIAPGSLRLSEANLDFAGGSIVLSTLAVDPNGITTRGRMSDFPTSYLTALTREDPRLKTTVTMSGEWDIAAREKLNGRVSLNRERGDVTVLDPREIALGLNSLELKAEARDSAISGRLIATGAKLGSVAASARVALRKLDGAWRLVETAPLELQASAELPSLAWVSALLPNGITLDGAGKLELSANGIAANPQWQGMLSGEALKLDLLPRIEDRGSGIGDRVKPALSLREGRLRAEVRSRLDPSKPFSRLAGNIEFSAMPRASLNASFETALSQRAGGWTLPDDAPLLIQAHAEMPLATFAAGSIESVSALDGALSAGIHATGTVAKPKLKAILAGEKLDATLVDSGLQLKGGSLRAELSTDPEAGGAGAINASVNVSALPFAEIHANIKTAYSRKNGAWGLPGAAPLALSAEASVPSLNWASAFFGPGATVDGALSLNATAQGTVSDPNVKGSVAGDGLRVVLAELGLDLGNGTLRADLQGDELLLRQFRMEGGSGTLTATGRAGFAQKSVSLSVLAKADQLRALNRPDRLLIVTGAANLALEQQRLRAAAEFNMNRGMIELPKADAPRLGDDVVIVGQQSREKRARQLPASLDVKIDLGEEFYLRGKGIDARLAGDIRVVDEGRGLPRAIGAIRVAEGTYSAYGQRLTVERGILNFTGPVNNPGLDILAMRKNQPVEAGVKITGTALTPRAHLVSNPNVPDSEKLAWLVLGHGLEDTSGAEVDAIQTAAGALLAQGDSATLQARIAQATGLDEVGVRRATSGSSGSSGSNGSNGSNGKGVEGTVLTLGKRIYSRVYVSYEQGLTGASNLVKIKYALTPRWTVQTQAGSDNAMDLFYTLSFD
jgi:translocation and assembly module TamB